MQTIVAANWKMFKTMAEAQKTAMDLQKNIPHNCAHTVIIFPPFTAIHVVCTVVQDNTTFAVGAQNMYPAHEGAFTGEISPALLRDAGATWVLTGHSERRHVMGESHEFIKQKVAFALAQQLHVMLCIGERLPERESGQLESVLKEQLYSAVYDIATHIQPHNFAIAYEPVWAIGTGKVATLSEVMEAHSMVRSILTEILGNKAHDIAILYGGSVKPDNAHDILALDNVNGLLVGGASLQAEIFAKIVMA